MRNGINRRDALLAGAAGAAAVAGSYLATGWTPSFVVRPVDQTIVNVTPGPDVPNSMPTLRQALEYSTVELRDTVSRLEEKDAVTRTADRTERLSTTI